MDWEGRYTYKKGESLEDLLLSKKEFLLSEWSVRSIGQAEATQRAKFIDELMANWSWLRGTIPDETCVLPLLHKYVVFAHTFGSGDHPPDEMIDNLYEEAMRVATLATKKVSRKGCSQPSSEAEKEWGYKMSDEEKGIHNLCYLATHPAETIKDKVYAIEQVISTRHRNGPIFDHLCAASQDGIGLVDIILDMLAE